MAAYREGDMWRVRKRVSGCPGFWQVLLSWGQVTLTVCWPEALALLGPDLPNLRHLQK